MGDAGSSFSQSVAWMPIFTLAAADTAPLTALTGVVVVFGAALAAAWLMRLLRWPTILGFLAAGVLIGPACLNLVPRVKVEFFAELGLVLLLFTIGLELSPAPLLRLGKRLLAAAGLQIAAITLTAGLLAVFLGGVSVPAAVILGIAIALSSTAIVLKSLADRGEVDTPAGSLTTGILLLQDLVVIFVLLLLPVLGEGATTGPWRLVLQTVAAFSGLVLVIFVARLCMPHLVRWVFRFGGTDLTTLFAIVMACTGAWLAGLANWSWPLGSFIAGLLLAQTDIRHQLRAEITPFRDAFNALFFIAIGMLVEPRVFATHAGLLALLIGVTLVLKTALTATAVRTAGWPLRLALVAGLGLCTMSEFGYVLLDEATTAGLVPSTLLPLFVAWTVGTMFVGALLVPVAAPLAARLTQLLTREHPTPATPASAAVPSPGHVIIVGYGINGRNLATALHATAIPFQVIEMHPANAHRAHKEHPDARVLIGDAGRRMILDDAGLQHARALVISINDIDATRRIIAQAHAARPDLYILARTRFVKELEPLHRLGAAEVIPEEFETSIELFAHVLKQFAVPDNVIAQQIALARAGRYAMLRDKPMDRALLAEWSRVLEAAVTQTLLIQEGSAACGQSIRELDLRAATGVMIVAITRQGKAAPNPPADFRLQAGDVLVLVGTHRQLDAARHVLTPAAAE